MNYILTILTFLLLYLSLKINNDDFAAPSVLFSLCFFVSSVLMSINTLVWNYVISPFTVMIIVLGILVFILGCQSRKNYKFVWGLNKRIYDKTSVSVLSNDNYSFSIPIIVTLIMVFVGLLAIIIRLMSIRSVTGSINIFSGNVLRAYRNTETIPYITILKFLASLTEAIALVYVLIIINNICCKKRVRLINSLPIFNYFVFSVLSSARIEIIYLFIIFLVMYVFVSRVKNHRKLTFKQIVLISATIVSVFLLFFFLGFLTGKSQSQISIADNIAMYSASSIPAFDNYLDSFSYDIHNFGMYSFRGIYNALAYLGIKIDTVSRNADFVLLGNMNHMTNIYTCFRPLLNDFNFLGMYFVLFIEGRIFQGIYIKAYSSFVNDGKPVWLMFYAYSAGYLALSSIAERVFSSWLTLTTIVFVAFLCLFNRAFLIKEKD